MASPPSSENVTQCKTCRCGEGDTNLLTTRASDNPDKQTYKCPNCDVFKSGSLLVSSKGIGWTSWKKRWFVLTRTSLVFYRTDPATLPEKGSEANPTLGGIDLNSSGSVVVKADKKLLTVLFPDGRDGRTFTLKAETSEDLYEWKAALENALAQAPSAVLAMGQNGIFNNDVTDSVETSNDKCGDREPEKSTIVGMPILLALEDIDGSPSFLEKALRFIEQHGIKVEGILRQSADVEEVKRRVREYEQGKVEFSPDEDAHVVGDCIKYVLREMSASPVPASCCTALVEAYRTDRGRRVNAIRSAIYKTFPEPSLRLMQRILKMMQTVASHKSQNRMSLSALAACMAPLLLRPLLAGDCEFEDDFNMGGDGSIQLLKAAAAANHAQAIVIILLEEFDKMFDEDLLHEGSASSDPYSDSEGDLEDDVSTDNDIPEDHDEHDSNDDLTDNDITEDDGYHDEHNSNDDYSDNDIPEDDGYGDEHNGLEADIDDDSENSCSETNSESHSNIGNDPYDNELIDNQKRGGASLQEHQKSSQKSDIQIPGDSSIQKHETLLHDSDDGEGADKPNKLVVSIKRPAIWGRTPARKNLSMESIDLSEDENAIQRLENTKNDLQNKIAKEVKGNAVLQESLQRRKEVLHERRLALEQDVERLLEQLQNEQDFRASLENGLMNTQPGNASLVSAMDSKTRADLEEVALAEADIVILKLKVDDLHGQLNNQLKRSCVSLCESCSRQLHISDHSGEKTQLEDVRSINLVDQHNKFLKQAEDALSGVAHEAKPVKEQELPFSEVTEPSLDKKSDPICQNAIGLGTRSSSSTEDSLSKFSQQFQTRQSNSETPVSCISYSERNADCENVETQPRESVSPSDGQPSEKQRIDIANQSRKLSKGLGNDPSTEESARVGQITASKNFTLGCEDVNQAQDSSLPGKQSLLNQWPTKTALDSLRSQTSASVSSSEPSGVAKRLSSRPEETVSSTASALAKLTNRLNLLKERRAQLANELQIMHNGQGSGASSM
ncbi:rho GTPase-activating protein 6-like isoform X2 [Musa acuminata AAA Group]|uniref:rho GTPase-activating protein 6-like isoform X2 n=1 Tax=Musa acuminata AAA Group TaxID=214697 RepID=UPI0031D82BC7